MKKLILSVCFIFLGINFLSACSSNCLECHPKLDFNKPKIHLFIKKCIDCHNKGCAKEEDMILNSDDLECGKNCFSCHKALPTDKNHTIMKKCYNCHKLIS